MLKIKRAGRMVRTTSDYDVIRDIGYIIVVNVIGWWCLSLAMKYGGIWDSQVHPIKNAEVELIDGRVVTGSLSSGWGLEQVLKTNDGTAITFREFRVIKTSSPTDEGKEWFMLKHWRSLVPMMIVICAMAIALLMPLRNFVALGRAMGKS
jgi:hypothetical protein